MFFVASAEAVVILLMCLAGYFRERAHSRERLMLFDRGLSAGDPATYVNLRRADAIAEDKLATGLAKESEQARLSEVVESTKEDPEPPWASCPSYAGCRVEFAGDRVFILNEANREMWDMSLDDFYGSVEKELERLPEDEMPLAMQGLNRSA